MESTAARLSSSNTDDVAALLRDASYEATFPTQAEIDGLRALVPAGTRVYLSCPPNHDPAELVGPVRAVRAAGLEPVPHLTARSYTSAAHLDAVLSRLAAEAEVRIALTIAGDRDEPAGPFAGALDLVESGRLEASGIRSMAIAGYPDGHPKIGNVTLAQALYAKLDAAKRHGLDVRVTSQFCFDPELILTWLRRLRGEGVTAPVSVGLAGPTSMRALVRYAMRCGVRASMRGMLNPKAMQLLGEAAPDAIVRALAEAPDRAQLGPVGLHFFSFGGLVRTGQWAAAVAAGRIHFQGDGFRVVR